MHNSNVLSQLSEFEKALCKKMTRIEIIGKRVRFVPVILTSTTRAALQTLVDLRGKVGVSEFNLCICKAKQ